MHSTGEYMACTCVIHDVLPIHDWLAQHSLHMCCVLCLRWCVMNYVRCCRAPDKRPNFVWHDVLPILIMIRQFLFWSDMHFVVRVVHDVIIIMRVDYSFIICLFICMYLYIYFGEDAMEVSDCNSWDYYLSLTKVYSNLNTSSGILFWSSTYEKINRHLMYLNSEGKKMKQILVSQLRSFPIDQWWALVLKYQTLILTVGSWWDLRWSHIPSLLVLA